MHEAGLMQTALDLATAAAREHGATRVTRVRLRVGAWSGVVPDALEFAFESLRTGTLADTATLELETVPPRCRCPSCMSVFTPVDFDVGCTTCGAFPTELIAGRELELSSVEVAIS